MNDLITNDQAAALLGVSLSTFNRARGRLGLRPVPGARVKPLYFDRAQVLAARQGAPVIAPARTAKTLLARTAVVPLPVLKAASKAARNGRGK